jgi:cysteine-rich secretory family protein
MRRKGALAVATISALAVVLAGLGAVASTSSAEESFVSRINSERTSRGLRAVSVASDLVSISRSWSAHMASAGAISHDPNLPNEVSGWSQLGDNVGRGGTVDSIHTAFMNSPEHRSIILDPAFTQVGVGVASSGDRLYVTEIFVRRTVKRVTATRTTTVRRTVSHPRTSVAAPVVASDVELTGLVWEMNLGPQPVTVSVLEQLVGFDAPSVNPQTGDAN